MFPHKSEDKKDGTPYGEVDTVEDIERVPTVEDNYHGLTISVVLIYLVRSYPNPKTNTNADMHNLSPGPSPR